VVLLRRWERTDVVCAAEGKGFGPEQAIGWIEAQWRRRQDDAGLSLAIADAEPGGALGCISLSRRPRPGLAPRGRPDGLLFEPQPATAGVGYWVLERARGRGLASRALALLVRWALTEAALTRIEALVEPGNTASLRVVERAGFTREGLLRAYLGPGSDGGRGDAFVYSLLASDAREAGPGPVMRGQAPG
jgi:RimJ/RimL family protein N-acetyltransferase